MENYLEILFLKTCFGVCFSSAQYVTQPPHFTTQPPHLETDAFGSCFFCIWWKSSFSVWTFKLEKISIFDSFLSVAHLFDAFFKTKMHAYQRAFRPVYRWRSFTWTATWTATLTACFSAFFWSEWLVDSLLPLQNVWHPQFKRHPPGGHFALAAHSR